MIAVVLASLVLGQQGYVPVPEEERVALHDALASRDKAIANIELRGRVVVRAEGQSAQISERQILFVRSGVMRKTEDTRLDAAGEFQLKKTSVWDGSRVSTRWEDPSQPGNNRLEVSVSKGGEFDDSALPLGLGIQYGEALYSDLLDAPFQILTAGESTVNGRPCMHLLVTREVPGTTQPVARIHLDVKETLLAIRYEHAWILADEDTDPDDVLEWGEHRYQPRIRYDVTETHQVQGVHFGVRGVQNGVRNPNSAHVTVPKESILVGKSYQPSDFQLQPFVGEEVRDLVTGESSLYATENPEGISAGVLDGMARAIAQLSDLPEPSQLRLESKEWINASCGVAASYLYLRSRSHPLLPTEVLSSIQVKPQLEMTLAHISDYVGGFEEVQARHVGWQGLVDHVGPQILYLSTNESDHHASDVGHFVCAVSMGDHVRVFDPFGEVQGINSIDFERLFDGKAVALRPADPAVGKEGGLGSKPLVALLFLAGAGALALFVTRNKSV